MGPHCGGFERRPELRVEPGARGKDGIGEHWRNAERRGGGKRERHEQQREHRNRERIDDEARQ